MYAYNPNRKSIAEVQILSENASLVSPASRLNDEFLQRPKPNGLRIDRTTPIASMEAVLQEIKFWLREQNYNYLQFATGPYRSRFRRYDRVYNTFSIGRGTGVVSLRQLVTYGVLKDGWEQLLTLIVTVLPGK